jgi:hypothetical protein
MGRVLAQTFLPGEFVNCGWVRQESEKLSWQKKLNEQGMALC